MTENLQGRKRSVIAIDPGDNLAFCHVLDGRPHEVGGWTWKQKRGMSAGMRYLKFIPYFTRLLNRIQNESQILAVACEQMFHRGGAASDVLKGYEIQIQTVCAKLGVEHLLAPISAVKKFATGKGNAKKAAMARYLELWLKRHNLGYKAMSEDMVDATWIALWAWREVTGE